MMRNQGVYMNSSKESGVAIWYILIGIILFAALSFSFVRSISQSQTNTSQEQGRIIANEILQYAKSIEQTVQRLRLVNGCSENDISFYSDEWSVPANYDNANTPNAGGDYNCHVFHREGGGINWKDASGNDGSEYVFAGRLRVNNVGDSLLSDLLIVLPNVELAVCEQMNVILGSNFANNPPQDAANANYAGFFFQGTFTSGNLLNGDVDGYPTACFEGGASPAPGTYHFYHTLLIR